MSEGRKNDIGKLRMDLIPVSPLEQLAEVYTIGCKKYADRNWEKGIAWSRCYGALIRHLLKFWKGESIDSQDGQHHLAAVVFYAFALMEYEKTHPELDDRPNKKMLSIQKSEQDSINRKMDFNNSTTTFTTPVRGTRVSSDWRNGIELPSYASTTEPDATGHS